MNVVTNKRHPQKRAKEKEKSYKNYCGTKRISTLISCKCTEDSTWVLQSHTCRSNSKKCTNMAKPGCQERDASFHSLLDTAAATYYMKQCSVYVRGSSCNGKNVLSMFSSGIIYKKMQVPHNSIPGNNQINVTSNRILEAPKIDVYALSPNGKGKK